MRLEYEAEGLRFLFRGLNNESGRIWTESARKRVLGLLADLLSLESIRRELGKALGGSTPSLRGSRDWPWRDYKEHRLEELNRRGENLIHAVNKRLAYYAWSPAIHAVDFSGFEQHPNWQARSPSDREEKIAVWVLGKALTSGKIDRFRSCSECDLWFYALTQHQRYCSDTCRKKYASHSAEFKTKRRIYMRKYRKQEDAQDEAAERSVLKLRIDRTRSAR
jgi:hypothetical protein